MKSLWNDDEARLWHGDLPLRVYSSRLLGKEPSLVLHGGGNTSVKTTVKNLFGESEDILYVKGSGWDLETIEQAGFSPVRLNVLKKMAILEYLTDSDMVKAQRAAMIDPSAPNPSVEAILHAIIPFKFIDHSHADAVVTITNTKDGEKRIADLYGSKVLVVPYVMPGFILAKKVYDMIQNLDWQTLEGIILMNHGVLTFGEDVQSSYERMIQLVSTAENYLEQQGAIVKPTLTSVHEDLLTLAKLRRTVSQIRGTAVIARLDTTPHCAHFANLPHGAEIATRGPLTPDHVIRTKRQPVIIHSEEDLTAYAQAYREYFERHTTGQLVCLHQAPCWGVWPGHGLLSFGPSLQETQIISDIKDHTIQAIQQAEALGGWKALPEKDIFDMEYWELEQAKLRQPEKSLPFRGKVALVTGAANGIGKACVESLQAQGAVVAALDVDQKIQTLFNQPEILGLPCDVTNREHIQQAVASVVRHFGGLDILISNAGTFPVSESIAYMNPQSWERSLQINLSSHYNVLQYCIPYLTLGISPAVIIMASKNVPAPGPGVSAYSVAKAGLTQLARVAALELSQLGIRVNVIHPNAIFDTSIWTPEVLEKRARHYGISIEKYKTNNLLKVEITSKDVAALACVMAGPVFSKTTGAQVPIDGGNDRVI